MTTSHISIRHLACDLFFGLVEDLAEHAASRVAAYRRKWWNAPAPAAPAPDSSQDLPWPPWRPQLSHTYTENYYYAREDCYTIPGGATRLITKGTRMEFTGLSSWDLHRECWIMGMTTEQGGDSFMMSSKDVRPGEEISREDPPDDELQDLLAEAERRCGVVLQQARSKP